MRIVDRAEDLKKEFEEAKNESKKAFGDDKLFIEKIFRSPKHVEVQILGDRYGNVFICLTVTVRYSGVTRRWWSMRRPSPCLTRPGILSSVPPSAWQKKVGYENAGTLDFLVDDEGNPYFIEMNPRIQVEHTISEMVTNVDLVQSQILIAEGYPWIPTRSISNPRRA